ncbi:MAG: hypothetical protein AAF802_29520 [Planctomycetota bacterium]
MKRNRRHQQRSGFLLVTVVTMLAVVTLMLSQLASRSMRTAQQAVLQEHELQKRWATYSIRTAALENARELLRAESLRTGRHASSVRRRVVVDGQSYDLLISDESAKVNLPVVRLALGTEATESLVRSLTTSRLRPNQQVNNPELLLGKRWEDWFDAESIAATASTRELARGTSQLTLWGSQKLNVSTCSPQAIEGLWRALLSRPVPEELLEVSAEFPAPALSAVLARLSLRESELNAVRPWLTTESDCYSVWVFPSADSTAKSEFAVEWGVGRGKSQRGYWY